MSSSTVILAHGHGGDIDIESQMLMKHVVRSMMSPGIQPCKLARPIIFQNWLLLRLFYVHGVALCMLMGLPLPSAMQLRPACESWAHLVKLHFENAPAPAAGQPMLLPSKCQLLLAHVYIVIIRVSVKRLGFSSMRWLTLCQHG